MMRRRESHACYGFVENRGQITLTHLFNSTYCSFNTYKEDKDMHLAT